MRKFGWKALFRALVIVAAIYLVRYGIEVVRNADGTYLKIGLVIGFFAAVLLIMILPALVSPPGAHNPVETATRTIKMGMAEIRRAVKDFLAEPMAKYATIIFGIIATLLIAQALIDGTRADGLFLSRADKQLAQNFVEWFGVLYGFLLPTILVKVWEQFDAIDNVLDREADAVNSLVGDLMLLDEQHKPFRDQVLRCLYEYSSNVVGFVNKQIPAADEMKDGEKILRDLRGYYINIFRKGGNGEAPANEALQNELLSQLNNLIDYRGDRISLSTQRLFQTLKFIAVVTSILWLVPFYFLHFQDSAGNELQLGVFGWLLVIFVTFLIIVILSIIDDLDEPFDGSWMVNIGSWTELVEDIRIELPTVVVTDTPKTDTADVPDKEVQSGPVSVTQIPLSPIEATVSTVSSVPTVVVIDTPKIDNMDMPANELPSAPAPYVAGNEQNINEAKREQSKRRGSKSRKK
jgi:hypothetical protein